MHTPVKKFSSPDILILAFLALSLNPFPLFGFPSDGGAPWGMFVDSGVRLIGVAVCLMSPTVRSDIFAALGRGIGKRRTRAETVNIAISGGILIAVVAGSIFEWARLWMLYLFPPWRLDTYPLLQEPLLIAVDLTFGLAIVALSEEVLYRGAIRNLLERLKCPRPLIVLIAAIPFALIHLDYGLANTVSAGLFGVVWMAVYLATGSLWPGIVSHYLVNLWVFSDYYGIL